MKDHVVEAVREDLLQRSQLGIKKYGVTLDRNDLSLKEWLQYAYEECLDQANYLKRSIIELDNIEKDYQKELEETEELYKKAEAQYPETLQQLRDKEWEDYRQTMYEGWLAKEKQKWEKEKQETEAADSKYNAIYKDPAY